MITRTQWTVEKGMWSAEQLAAARAYEFQMYHDDIDAIARALVAPIHALLRFLEGRNR